MALFMMMGAALQPVSTVPAGNVLALAGLEGRVNKCATLSDVPECPAMRAVTLQVGGYRIESFDMPTYKKIVAYRNIGKIDLSVDRVARVWLQM